MKILALECGLPGATAEQFHQYEKTEAHKVWELTLAGFLHEVYFRIDTNEVVLILESASTREAEFALSTLPFVQNKLIRFELIPLKTYPGYERWFVKD